MNFLLNLIMAFQTPATASEICPLPVFWAGWKNSLFAIATLFFWLLYKFAPLCKSIWLKVLFVLQINWLFFAKFPFPRSRLALGLQWRFFPRYRCKQVVAFNQTVLRTFPNARYGWCCYLSVPMENCYTSTFAHANPCVEIERERKRANQEYSCIHREENGVKRLWNKMRILFSLYALSIPKRDIEKWIKVGVYLRNSVSKCSSNVILNKTAFITHTLPEWAPQSI